MYFPQNMFWQIWQSLHLSTYVTMNTGTDPEIKLRQAFEMFDEEGTNKLTEE